jgi:hypothetical protein
MKHCVLMIACLLSAELLATPASIANAAKSHHRSHSHRQATVSAPASPARIACTAAGCQPIPSGCMPVPGRTWSGLPTGYDVVVCPPGGSPLR